MSKIIPYDPKNLPSYLKHFNVSDMNNALTAHANTGGFPVISIKGKIWAIKRDGVRAVVPNPKDPDSAASSIEVVILQVNENKSKVFYATGWKEGDDAKPTCFSNDGKTPEASVEKPQSKSCATCKHNQWGSKISDSGTKLKACVDSIRMAVAPAGVVEDAMLLRVPPASMSAAGEYGKLLNQRKVRFNQVVTRIYFDSDASTPKLKFEHVGMFDEETVEQIQEISASELVQNIVYGTANAISDNEHADFPSESEKVIERASKSAKVQSFSNDDVEEILQDAVIEEAAAEKKAAPKKAKAVQEVDIDINLDDLDFDD